MGDISLGEPRQHTMPPDLYTEFLHLPPEPRPLNHYEILALPLFEPDRAVIHAAVLRQTKELKRWALHPDPATMLRVQEMLNEVGRAGFILEDPKTKAEYDRQLAEPPGTLSPPQGAGIRAAEPAPAAVLEAPARLRACPSCGAVIGVEAVLCPTCGHDQRARLPVEGGAPAQGRPAERQDSPTGRSLARSAIVVVAALALVGLGAVLLGVLSPARKPADPARKPAIPYRGAGAGVAKSRGAPGTQAPRTAPSEPEAAPPSPDAAVAVLARLKDAIRRSHKFLAEQAFADLKRLVPADHRLESLWEEVAALPGPSGQLRLDLGGGVAMEFVLVPAGSFLMGSESSLSERPVRTVSIPRPFYLGKFEVTQEQWGAVMGRDPSRLENPRNPVDSVSWVAAQEFARRLGQKHAGWAIGLPTEAEWEYACRAGTTTQFCFGDDEAGLGEYAWYRANSGGTIHPVGQKKPNAWGLHDMHGNVWEWCEDRYGGYEDAPTDGSARVRPWHRDFRVCRGGKCATDASFCRSSTRVTGEPNQGLPYVGFRVCLRELDRAAPPTPPVPVTPPPYVDPRRFGPRAAGTLIALLEEAIGRQEKFAAEDLAEELKKRFPNEARLAELQQKVAAIAGPAERETVDLGEGVSLELILIRPGAFMMGSFRGARWEAPVRREAVANAFYLGKYEVTQEQWQAVMGNNPSRVEDPKCPVDSVSWYECQAFLSRLSARLGTGRFRLPTEVEWEYACRAVRAAEFGFRNDEERPGDDAWHSANAAGAAHPVGQKPPSAWGLHDMRGNVSEWCEDVWSETPSRAGPRGWERVPGDDPQTRSLRGGSWLFPASVCRSAFRSPANASWRAYGIGFRVCQRLDGAGRPEAPGAAPEPPPPPPPPRPAPAPVPAPRPSKPGEIAITPIVPPSAPAGLPPPAHPRAVSFLARLEEALAYRDRPAAEDALRELDRLVPTDPRLPALRVKLAAIPVPRGQLTLKLSRSITLELRLIRPGTFVMGSGAGPAFPEMPIRQAVIPSAFYIGTYEVTQEQWEAVMGRNPCYRKNPKSPVDNVSWYECQQFLRELSAKLEVKGFCLPSEIEWEYACRAGTTTEFCFGDQEALLGDYGWYSANANGMAHPVGQKKANAWGLHDMHGNVAEWCEDEWVLPFRSTFPRAPLGSDRDMTNRVVRGGGYHDAAPHCRSAARGQCLARYGTGGVGLRVCLREL